MRARPTHSCARTQAADGGRVVFVSSGGMYNTRWPGIADADAASEATKYDGQMAYAYAKRGQVLLAERFTTQFPDVKFASCHPGWVDTPGVDAAYENQKKYLQPLRSLWQARPG